MYYTNKCMVLHVWRFSRLSRSESVHQRDGQCNAALRLVTTIMIKKLFWGVFTILCIKICKASAQEEYSNVLIMNYMDKKYILG